MKNCNKILTEKQQKYLLYHLEKSINIRLTDDEIVPFNQKQTIEQAKCAYYLLGKNFEKTNKND